MLYAPNHLRLKYDYYFGQNTIVPAGTIVKIIKVGGTPEWPEYLVEAYSGTRLVIQSKVSDWVVERIKLLRPFYTRFTP